MMVVSGEGSDNGTGSWDVLMKKSDGCTMTPSSVAVTTFSGSWNFEAR